MFSSFSFENLLEIFFTCVHLTSKELNILLNFHCFYNIFPDK